MLSTGVVDPVRGNLTSNQADVLALLQHTPTKVGDYDENIPVKWGMDLHRHYLGRRHAKYKETNWVCSH